MKVQLIEIKELKENDLFYFLDEQDLCQFVKYEEIDDELEGKVGYIHFDGIYPPCEFTKDYIEDGSYEDNINLKEDDEAHIVTGGYSLTDKVMKIMV